MTGVWKSLGYEEIVRDLTNSLVADNTLDVIQGPPGTGKSFLARGVGAMWEQAGGRTIVAEGAELRADVRLYALGLAIARLSSGWQGIGQFVTKTGVVGEGFIGTGGITTTAIQTIAANRPKRRQARKLYLGDDEQEVLFEIEKLAGEKPLLLIADNLHWWDADSLELLGRFREPRMRASFGVLSDMRVLAVQTPDRFQPAAHPQVVEALLSEQAIRPTELNHVSRDGFESLLTAFGAPNPTPEVADLVYSLSQGHLAIANRCAVRLQDDPSGSSLLSTDGDDQFLSRLLGDRLRSMGARGKSALQLLRIAAVAGHHFNRREISCVWNGEDDLEISGLLRLLRDENFVHFVGDACWFVHEIYQRHFLSEDASFDRVMLYERMANCLRIERPGAYVARSENALKAERTDEAAILGVQAALAAVRDGKTQDQLPLRVTSAISAGGLSSIGERLALAAQLQMLNKAAECLEVLAGLPHSISKPLLGEADYLRASCLMQTRSVVDQDEARRLLASWTGYELEEAELGVRLMQLRLYALAMMTDKEEAREVESQLKSVLRNRVSFDPAAEDALYTLDRCAPAIYEPETSLPATRDAAAHFAGPLDQETVRRPIELYRSQMNYGAELLVAARFHEAREVSGELQSLVASYGPGTFPRIDEPFTNALLADVRDGAVTPAQAVRRQQEIISDHGRPDDPFYVGNALAIYLALSGDLDPALAEFDELLRHLNQRQHPIPSIDYVLRANRCSTLFLAGERSSILAEWKALDPVVRQIPYPITPILVKRHELLLRVFELGNEMTPADFDECLIVGRKLEYGPLWNQLGRGFRAPEIQWFY